MLVVLPAKFTIDDIVTNYIIYYPFQYFIWEDMNKTYKQKNKFLLSVKKKKRYNEYRSFKEYLLFIPGVKCLLSSSSKGKLPVATVEEVDSFIKSRQSANIRKKEKIEAYKNNICNGENPFDLDPLCLYTLIKEYHNDADIVKKTKIVDFLMKYTGEYTIQFFKKLNDVENNKSIRRKAFEHLQSLGYYVKLQPNPSKQNKAYASEKFDVFTETFDDLFYEMNKVSSIERKKQFHFFISHNNKDKETAAKIVDILNSNGYDCYYCWIHDSKDGMGNYLKQILDLRIKQSKIVIKVNSEKHKNSEWCQYEIERALSTNKKVITYNIGEDVNEFAKEIISIINV